MCADTVTTHNLLPDTPVKTCVIKQSAEDREIDGTPDNPNAGSGPQNLIPTPLSDDHSRVEPPLPIPNRTVKRSRANDSRHYACESRSSSDSLYRPRNSNPQEQNPLPKRGGFLLHGRRAHLGLRGTGSALLDLKGFLYPAYVAAENLFVSINHNVTHSIQLKLYGMGSWLRVRCRRERMFTLV